MSNHHKIISLHGAAPGVWQGFFRKKTFYGGQTFLGKKIMGRLL